MTPSQNEFPSPDKITSGRPQAPSKHSATVHVESRYATEEELPTVHASSMLLQTMQQIQQQSQQAMQQSMQQSQQQTRMMQQSMQQSQQRTQMMQQMMEQMTKLMVKQPTPRAPTPTRSTRDCDKNPTGTHKLTYVNTESDKSDTSMPDASPFVRRVTHRSVAEEDPDTTMPDAPTLRKSITHPAVHAFAPASKDYPDYGGLTRAQSIFPQQNKSKSVLKEEIYQPHPLQVHHAQVPIPRVQPKPDAIRPQRAKPQHAEESEIAQAVETIGTMIHQEMEAIEKKVESLSSEVAQQRIKLMSYDTSIPTAKQPATRHQQRYDVGTSEERFRRATEALRNALSNQMQTNTAAERRQHISEQQHDCRSQVPVAPEDCQRSLLLQSPPAQIQTDFDSQQAQLAPGLHVQRSRASQVSHTRHQHEQPRLNPRTEAAMDCKQPLSTSIESQIPWTYQKEILFVPREQSTSALPIGSKILPPYLKQALPVPSTMPHSRHVHKQPPPCDRLQKQLQPVPQKQHLPTQPPQEQFLPTRQFDQACPPHAQRPAAFPLNAETSDDAVQEDINGIPDRSSDDSGEECFADALNGNESLVTTHQGSSEDSEEEEEDHTSSMRRTDVYLFDESPPTNPADNTSDEFPTRPGEDSDIFQEGQLNENSVVSTKDLVVEGHAENEDLAASHEDARPEDAHIEEVVGPLGSNGFCPTELRKQESKEREILRGDFVPIAYTLSWEFVPAAQTPSSEVGSFLHHDKRLTPPAPKLPLAPMLPPTSIRTLTPMTPVALTTIVAFMIMTPVINFVRDFVVRYRLVERLVP